MNIFTSMKKRAEYHRTVRELSSLSPDVARDLNIYPGDAASIAFSTVYGK